jgi:hypothetical protein
MRQNCWGPGPHLTAGQAFQVAQISLYGGPATPFNFCIQNVTVQEGADDAGAYAGSLPDGGENDAGDAG